MDVDRVATLAWYDDIQNCQNVNPDQIKHLKFVKRKMVLNPQVKFTQQNRKKTCHAEIPQTRCQANAIKKTWKNERKFDPSEQKTATVTAIATRYFKHFVLNCEYLFKINIFQAKQKLSKLTKVAIHNQEVK